MDEQAGWKTRWLGGFCPPGVSCGLPVRDAGYPAHLPLEEQLVLPVEASGYDTQIAPVHDCWSALLGGEAVAVRNVARARALLLAAAGVEPGEGVGLPPNSSRALVEAVKQYGARPCFGTEHGEPARVGWREAVGGLLLGEQPGGAVVIVDAADTLPAERPPNAADATLWGMHLSKKDESEAGALIQVTNPSLLEKIRRRLRAADVPDWERATRQAARLPALAAAQESVLRAVREGLQEAAGLPLLASDGAVGLPHHVAVELPEVVDPPTFYAYARGENTPVRWLPEQRPLHYAAVRGGHRSQMLRCWFLVPVGPRYSQEEIGHAVLGLVKVSDYLGVRWFTDPARAAGYSAAMTARYGPDHDAYRPLFATTTQ
jgi:hypothetical protein